MTVAFEPLPGNARTDSPSTVPAYEGHRDGCLHRHCLIMQQRRLEHCSAGHPQPGPSEVSRYQSAKSRRSVRACRSVFEGDDMVTALRPIEVRTAAADEVPKVAAALADAFINDPVFTFLRPGRLRQKARLRTMFAVEMEQYVLANGGTVWTTPGTTARWPSCHPAPGRCRSRRRGRRHSSGCGRSGRDCPRAIRVQRAMEKRHLREPHFYVRTVGVRTALQGQGVGSTLMQPTLERADSAGLPTYIEASSERSAALYERLGFLHMGVFELPEGGPPVWPMRRPPAGAHVGPNG